MTLLLIPLAMALGSVIAVPGALGVFAGLIAVALYFFVMMLRASEWR